MMAIRCFILGHRWRCICGAKYAFPHRPIGGAWCSEAWSCTRCGAKGIRQGDRYG